MLNESNLHFYQKHGVDHIIDHPHSGLFLDMGLGKTTTTLTAVNELIYNRLEVYRVLVIAPKRVAESVWAEEAKKWEHLRHLSFVKLTGSKDQREKGLSVNADVYVINRENVVWLCKYYKFVLPFDMVVIDELSSFKDAGSKRFKALRKARPSISRLVGLTGTPSPNGLIDLWPQLYLIDMGQRLGKTITYYRDRYFSPGRANGMVVYSYNIRPSAEEEIQSKIADICISMKATDYLDMPECLYNVISVRMTDRLKEEYKKFEKDKIIELRDSEISISTSTAAVLIQKLLQFSNGALYDEDKGVHLIHDHKLEALEEIMEFTDRPVLVAYNFKFDRDRIKERFSKYGVVDIKDGDTLETVEKWNRGEIRMLLAHPASAGHGLNLQSGGSTVVWYGLHWSLELYQQFNARLYRQGQKQTVVIHHLVTEGTVDEDVMSSLSDKDKVQEKLMNSIKAKIENYGRTV